jgi:hypothetical protein
VLRRDSENVALAKRAKHLIGCKALILFRWIDDQEWAAKLDENRKEGIDSRRVRIIV